MRSMIVRGAVALKNLSPESRAMIVSVIAFAAALTYCATNGSGRQIESAVVSAPHEAS